MKRRILIGLGAVALVAGVALAFYAYHFARAMEGCCEW